MIYDTAGNLIQEPIQNCECGLTGGCGKCNPMPHWSNKLSELEAEQQKLDDWRRRFDEDLERRNKILFPTKPRKVDYK